MKSRPVLDHQESIRQRISTALVRPIRVGYIVIRDIDQEELRQLFQFNCSIWGGKYNIFVPTDGMYIREDWWRMLHQHDPDYIVYVGEVHPSLTRQVYDRLQPFWQYAWDETWSKSLEAHPNRAGSISIDAIFSYYQDSKGAVEPARSRCHYPVIGATELANYLEIAFGTYPTETRFRKGFVDIFGASETICAPGSFLDYLALVENLGQGLTPYEMTGFYLRPRFELGPQTPSLIVSSGTADDLFLYHVARQAGFTSSGKPLIIVPASELQSSVAFTELADLLRRHTHGNLMWIASSTIDKKNLQEIRRSLKPHLPDWQINLVCANFDLVTPLAFCTERQVAVYSDGSTSSFESPQIEFADFMRVMSKWVVEIKQLWPEPLRSGFVPSMFPSLNYLLSGFHDRTQFEGHHGSKVRVARGNLAIQTNAKDQITRFGLPSSEKLVSSVFQDAGFVVSYDEKGRYYEGMIRLAGNKLHNLDFLREEGILDILYALKDGRGRIWKELLGKAKLGRNSTRRERLEEIVFDLADRQILLRGVRLRCPTCDLETSYPFDTLGEQVECQGCRTAFQMRLDQIEFSYQANQLYIQGINNGAKTVLLTALLLWKSSLSGMHWKPGCKVRLPDSGLEGDLDLVAMCDGGLIIAECKDDLDKEFEERPNETLEQLQRDIEVSKAVKADLFILSTWSVQIPQPIQEALEAAVDKSSSLNVLTLGKEELSRGWIEETTEDQKKKRVFIDRFFKGLPGLEGDYFELDPEKSSGFIALG